MSNVIKKGPKSFKQVFILVSLLIFYLFYEDRNFISWKETFREAITIRQVSIIQRLTTNYSRVLEIPFPETDNHIWIAKVDKIRRQLIKRGVRTVWIKSPDDSSIYANPLKLNLYQRIVEILYPVRIDPSARYELTTETNPKGEINLKLIDLKKQR